MLERLRSKEIEFVDPLRVYLLRYPRRVTPVSDLAQRQKRWFRPRIGLLHSRNVGRDGPIGQNLRDSGTFVSRYGVGRSPRRSRDRGRPGLGVRILSRTIRGGSPSPRDRGREIGADVRHPQAGPVFVPTTRPVVPAGRASVFRPGVPLRGPGNDPYRDRSSPLAALAAHPARGHETWPPERHACPGPYSGPRRCPCPGRGGRSGRT